MDGSPLKPPVQKILKKPIKKETYAQLKKDRDLLKHNLRCFQEAYRDVYKRMQKAEAVLATIGHIIAAS